MHAATSAASPVFPKLERVARLDWKDAEAIRNRRVLNECVEIKGGTDVHLRAFGWPVFDATTVRLLGCDAFFVRYWLRKSVFPRVDNVFISDASRAVWHSLRHPNLFIDSKHDLPRLVEGIGYGKNAVTVFHRGNRVNELFAAAASEPLRTIEHPVRGTANATVVRAHGLSRAESEHVKPQSKLSLTWKDLQALEGRTVLNECVEITGVPNEHSYRSGNFPMFHATTLHIKDCHKTFVSCWLDRVVFPNVENVYLNNHPGDSCVFFVMSGANIYLRQNEASYKRRWAAWNEDVVLVDDKTMSDLFSDVKTEDPRIDTTTQRTVEKMKAA